MTFTRTYFPSNKVKICCKKFREEYELPIPDNMWMPGLRCDDDKEVWFMCHDCGTGEPINYCPWCGKKIKILRNKRRRKKMNE